MNRGVQWLLKAIATIVLVFLLEIGSRLLWPVDPPKPLKIPGGAVWSDRILPDPLLFWRMRPHILENGQQLTNRLGLRGPEVPPKRHDEFRILSLGESTTFGRRLAYEDTYSSLIQEGLGSVGGQTVRVINAGVPAYTLFQGVTYLEHRGLTLEPDAVLVYFGYNDFIPATRRGLDISARTQSGRTDRELLRHRKSYRFQTSSWMLDHSNLFRLGAVIAGGAAKPDPSTRRVPAADRARLLADLRDLCASHGVQLVVVIPWYRSFAAHIPLLRRFAAANGVPVVDLPDALRDIGESRDAYFVDKVHPNARGHRLIAGAILEEHRRVW